MKKIGRLPPSYLPSKDPRLCADEPPITGSDTPEEIANRLRQHSREAILGFIITFMRKCRQHGVPAPSPSTQDAHYSEPMDHHSAGVGTIIEDSKRLIARLWMEQ